MMENVPPPTPAVATVPWLEWDVVRKYVNNAWDPENTPHHSIIGLTGSGKSFLGVNGILKPMCSNDRVVILDMKGDDPTVSQTGRGVRELPRNTWYSKMGRRQDEPMDSWWRVVVHEDRAKAQQQVYDVLDRVYKEKNYVVFIDELFYITAREKPSLGLSPWVERIYRYGRTKHVSLVACTQSPRYVPTSFYDQASFAWIGRLRDEDKQKRLLEIGGLSRKELPYVSSLQRRQWLLSADNGEFFARTQVKL
jgi:hypothetical protein